LPPGGINNPFAQGEQSQEAGTALQNFQGAISSSLSSSPWAIMPQFAQSQQGFSISEYFLVFVFVIILLIMGILLLR